MKNEPSGKLGRSGRGKLGQSFIKCWNAYLGERSINHTLSVCLWIINDIYY